MLRVSCRIAQVALSFALQERELAPGACICVASVAKLSPSKRASERVGAKRPTTIRLGRVSALAL